MNFRGHVTHQACVFAVMSLQLPGLGEASFAVWEQTCKAFIWIFRPLTHAGGLVVMFSFLLSQSHSVFLNRHLWLTARPVLNCSATLYSEWTVPSGKQNCAKSSCFQPQPAWNESRKCKVWQHTRYESSFLFSTEKLWNISNWSLLDSLQTTLDHP